MKAATAAFDLFVETYGVTYERAVKKLTKDRDVLLTFYAFPAEHWQPHPHNKPDRKRPCHRTQPNPKDKGVPQPQNGTIHGLQADDPFRDIAAQYPVRQWSAKKNGESSAAPIAYPKSFKGLSSKTGSSSVQNAA
tara:strand:+ start:3368 stop:3772 length:405 start_codon:yes stop_codon:yes gene_type:complete